MSDDYETIVVEDGHLERLHLEKIARELERVREQRHLRRERHQPTHRRNTKYGPANDD